MQRRGFLRNAALAALALTGGLPALAELRTSPRDAFSATDLDQVLRILFGPLSAAGSEGVRIRVPRQVMRGRPVPVEVVCEIPGVDLIAIVSHDNPYPLKTFLSLGDAVGYYNTRITLQRSSTVSAYVRAGEGLYVATGDVKLTRGGYGT